MKEVAKLKGVELDSVGDSESLFKCLQDRFAEFDNVVASDWTKAANI